MTATELRSTRKAMGLSQSTLAERLNVDIRTVRRWENGERDIPPLLSLALAHLSCKPRKR
jgi:transcriptional regulator with XRE-family HTH domain